MVLTFTAALRGSAVGDDEAEHPAIATAAQAAIMGSHLAFGIVLILLVPSGDAGFVIGVREVFRGPVNIHDSRMFQEKSEFNAIATVLWLWFCAPVAIPGTSGRPTARSRWCNLAVEPWMLMSRQG
jgi:hypothetical protein